MCAAHGKRINDWLKAEETWELALALHIDLYGSVSPVNYDLNRNSANTRVSVTFPQLVMTKPGSPANGGGTWIHPDIATSLAMWCNPAFAIQQEELMIGQGHNVPEFFKLVVIEPAIARLLCLPLGDKDCPH